MDPIHSPVNTMSLKDRLQGFLTKKWLIALSAGVVLLSFITLVFMPTAPSQELPEPPPEVKKATATPRPPTVTPDPTKVEEQRNADKTYSDWERKVKVQYPWLGRIPVKTDRYFVYFNLDKKLFIGRLTPQQGDNVEQMKTEIRDVLKRVKGIPIENFQFEWTVTPQ